jgi:hypothetical protein
VAPQKVSFTPKIRRSSGLHNSRHSDNLSSRRIDDCKLLLDEDKLGRDVFERKYALNFASSFAAELWQLRVSGFAQLLRYMAAKRILADTPPPEAGGV